MKYARFALATVVFVSAGGCGSDAPGSGGGTGGSATGGGSAGGAGGTGGTGGSGGQSGRGGSGSGTGGSTGGASGSGGSGAGGSGGSGGAGTGGSGGGAGTGGSGSSDAAADGSAGDGAPGEGGVSARSVCPAGPFPTPMAGASQDVCGNFDFNYSYNEGPTWVASQGAFYFTNFVQQAPTGGDIIKYTPGGNCEIFARNVGCNGLAVTPDGAFLAACHQSRSVIRFDPNTKQGTPVATMYMGRMLDTPNDLVVHSNGTIYFTNPTFELGNRPPGVGPTIFRIDPTGTMSVIQMSSGNGIGMSPDQRRLYVNGGGTWDLDEAGVPSNRRAQIGGGDGLGVDCAGNVYASGGGIFSPQGQRIGSFPGGTNLAFGGPDGKTLLVAGGGNRVRVMQMNLPGLP